MMTLNEFIEHHYKDDDEKALALEYEQYMREHNPAVKEAWENYQFILNLTFNMNNEDFIKHKTEKKQQEREQIVKRLQALMKE